jgi:hypothetical protein
VENLLWNHSAHRFSQLGWNWGLRDQRNLLYGNTFIYATGDFNLREAQMNTVAYKICRAAKKAFGKYECI